MSSLRRSMQDAANSQIFDPAFKRDLYAPNQLGPDLPLRVWYRILDHDETLFSGEKMLRAISGAISKDLYPGLPAGFLTDTCQVSYSLETLTYLMAACGSTTVPAQKDHNTLKPIADQFRLHFGGLRANESPQSCATYYTQSILPVLKACGDAWILWFLHPQRSNTDQARLLQKLGYQSIVTPDGKVTVNSPDSHRPVTDKTLGSFPSNRSTWFEHQPELRNTLFPNDDTENPILLQPTGLEAKAVDEIVCLVRAGLGYRDEGSNTESHTVKTTPLVTETTAQHATSEAAQSTGHQPAAGVIDPASRYMQALDGEGEDSGDSEGLNPELHGQVLPQISSDQSSSILHGFPHDQRPSEAASQSASARVPFPLMTAVPNTAMPPGFFATVPDSRSIAHNAPVSPFTSYGINAHNPLHRVSSLNSHPGLRGMQLTATHPMNQQFHSMPPAVLHVGGHPPPSSGFGRSQYGSRMPPQPANAHPDMYPSTMGAPNRFRSLDGPSPVPSNDLAQFKSLLAQQSMFRFSASTPSLPMQSDTQSLFPRLPFFAQSQSGVSGATIEELGMQGTGHADNPDFVMELDDYQDVAGQRSMMTSAPSGSEAMGPRSEDAVAHEQVENIADGQRHSGSTGGSLWDAYCDAL